MLIIKNSNLSPIPQLQFIQNGTEIISYRSLTEKKFCGNLLIAVSVGNQPDDIQLPFADVSGSIIKSVGGLQELRDFGYDLCAEYGLAGVNRLKSRKNAGMILLQKITLCAEAEGFYNIFIIGKSSQKKNFCLRKFAQDLSGRFQSVHSFHTDIHQKNIRKILSVQSTGFFTIRAGGSHFDIRVCLKNGF